MSKEKRLEIQESDGHLVVKLNRPEARNAIDEALIDELHVLCDRLERDPQVLVITGAGQYFAAGADIRELRDRGPGEALRGINSRAFDRVAALPLPTIAAVNGPAIGGGAELAYACDFRLASPNASFANPEVDLGIIAAAGACLRLRELVGLPIATEVLIAGRRLNADEALACGLVSRIVPEDGLLDASIALAARIGRGTDLALRLTKIALRSPAVSHPVIDDVAQAVAFQSREKQQRMTDFLEKRSPR